MIWNEMKISRTRRGGTATPIASNVGSPWIRSSVFRWTILLKSIFGHEWKINPPQLFPKQQPVWISGSVSANRPWSPGSNPVSVITQIQLLIKHNKWIHSKHWLKNVTNLLKNESDKREWYQRDSENLKCRKKSAQVSKLRTAWIFFADLSSI